MEEIKTEITVERVGNGFILSNSSSNSKHVAKNGREVKEYITSLLSEVDIIPMGTTATFTIVAEIENS